MLGDSFGFRLPVLAKVDFSFAVASELVVFDDDVVTTESSKSSTFSPSFSSLFSSMLSPGAKLASACDFSTKTEFFDDDTVAETLSNRPTFSFGV